MNVNIIGCSHSSGLILPFTHEVNYKKGWTYYVSLQYPNLMFKNYSLPGMGYQYFDYVLSKLAIEDPDSIVILQLTTPRETFGYINFEDLNLTQGASNYFYCDANIFNEHSNIFASKYKLFTTKIGDSRCVRGFGVFKKFAPTNFTENYIGNCMSMEKYQAWFNKFALYTKMFKHFFVIDWTDIEHIYENIVKSEYNLDNIKQINYIINEECKPYNNHLSFARQIQIFNKYFKYKNKNILSTLDLYDSRN